MHISTPFRRTRDAYNVRCVRYLMAVLLATGFLLSPKGPAATPMPADLIKIRLAVTIGLHYVRYLYPSPTRAEHHIKLCVVGPDRFSVFFRQKAVQVRNVHLTYLVRQDTDDNTDCHIVYLTLSDDQRIRHVLRKLYGKPVLTVSDKLDFLQQGGMLVLLESKGKVVFELNPVVAQVCGLRFHADVLRLAKKIVAIPAEQIFGEVEHE